MKRLLLIPVFALCCMGLRAQEAADSVKVAVVEALTATSIDQAGRDTTLYPNLYLDTVKVSRKLVLNDYSLLGVQGGVSFNRMSFNPTQKQETVMHMPYFSLSYTHYYKMFGLFPYFQETTAVVAESSLVIGSLGNIAEG